MRDTSDSKFDWRAHLKVHRAADLFPMMSETELQELAGDIRRNGLQTPILLWDEIGSRRHICSMAAIVSMPWHYSDGYCLRASVLPERKSSHSSLI
jgi:hypothetical protein